MLSFFLGGFYKVVNRPSWQRWTKWITQQIAKQNAQVSWKGAPNSDLTCILSYQTNDPLHDARSDVSVPEWWSLKPKSQSNQVVSVDGGSPRNLTEMEILLDLFKCRDLKCRNTSEYVSVIFVNMLNKRFWKSSSWGIKGREKRGILGAELDTVSRLK